VVFFLGVETAPLAGACAIKTRWRRTSSFSFWWWIWVWI